MIGKLVNYYSFPFSLKFSPFSFELLTTSYQLRAFPFTFHFLANSDKLQATSY